MNNKSVVPEAREGLNRFKMAIGGQIVNIMTLVRTLHFQRKSRIKRGYTVTVGYAFGLVV